MFQTDVIDEGIAPVLASHQQAVAWNWKDLAQKLYDFDRKLRDRFSLDLPPFVIRFGRLHRSRLGHFLAGCNEFAISGEIAINVRYANVRSLWEIIGTLHHEQLHLWQHVHGRAGKHNYHNREFQRKARESGLVVDSRGYTQYQPKGPFVVFLQEQGIDVPDLPEPVEGSRPPRFHVGALSKLKRWSCQCTNVWAAIQEVNAKCLRCDQLFRKDAPRAKISEQTFDGQAE